MQLEPGMRVRCVASGGNRGITNGHNYIVSDVHEDGVFVRLRRDNVWYMHHRFKPIVRVKAPTRKGCCNKGCNGCEDFAFRARLHRFATSGTLA